MAGHMSQFINKVLHVTTDDGRDLTGKLIVFDRHMNMVLADVKESRPLSKKAGEAKAERSLGLILLRGEHVVSLNAEKSASSTSGAPARSINLPPGTGTVKTAQKRAREE